MTTPEASLVLPDSSSTSVAQPPNSLVPQIVTIQNDNSALPTGVILNETNYALWSQLMEIRIATILGSISVPAEFAPTFDAWTTENLRVKGWLIDSMSPELMGRFIRLRTAKEIWVAVKKVFYDGSDESQVYELNRKAFTLKQNGQPVSKYYSMLQSLFQELDHRDPPSMEPKLDLDQSFAYVRRDAQQRANFTGAAASLDATVMVAQRSKGPPSSHGSSSTQGVKDKPVFKCTHCGGSKHTREHCYELDGFPSWWDHSKNKRNGHKALQAFATPETPPVSGNKSNEHTSASASMATSGTTGYALNVSSTSPTSNVWIIDLGASDHMTCDSNKITSLSPSSQSVVSNANGSSSPVVGDGSLSLTDSLHLDSVLVVPSLDFNLLSVAQITHALFCTVTFWPNCCIFQDILTRKIIGYGTRKGKLYFLDLATSGETRISQAFKTSGDSTEKNQNFIWLWHRWLGHASFGYLKKLFPSWFSKLSDFNFKCDVCELAKSHRVSFPLSMNKSTMPFAIVHSDVWGPAPISTSSGAPQQVGASSTQVRVYWLCPTSKRVSLLSSPTQKLYITMDVVFREEEMYFFRGVQALASPDTVDDRFDLEDFVTLESLCHPTVQDALTNSSDTTPETTHDSLDDRSRLVSSPITQSPIQGEKNDVLMPVSEVSVPFNQLSSEVSSEPTTQESDFLISVVD
ncbi:hypothetical protein L3X38_033603 [Prunus dulcis]|uniref:GAG-pre-integrase domain-containing protein n=1 Tax=Prunus dulcis TaxID=3755 RepID=A0AAD4VG98_PRUDU|nr:hypothetical protein L3X38_033603 [Prunus dulcis]